jgi:endonuclease G
LPRERPAVDIVDGDFFTAHPLWQKLNDDTAINSRLRAAIPAIGRIELPGQSRIPYGGTGFLVGSNLLMTNCSVAEIFASGLGNKNLHFRLGAAATIDFRRERDRATTDTLRVTGIRMIHPYRDMALLEVEGASDRAPLQLARMPIDDLEGREIAVIGYSAFDPFRNDRTVQNALFSSVYGLSGCNPGASAAAAKPAALAAWSTPPLMTAQRLAALRARQ